MRITSLLPALSVLLGASCTVYQPLHSTVVSDPQMVAPAPQAPQAPPEAPAAPEHRPEVAVLPIEDSRLFRAERAALRAELAAHLARVAPDHTILAPAMVDPKLKPVSEKTGHRCAYEGEPLSRRAWDEGLMTTDVMHVGLGRGKGEVLWIRLLSRGNRDDVTFEGPWDPKLGLVDRYRAAFASLVRKEDAGILGGLGARGSNVDALVEGPVTICEERLFGSCDPGSIDWKDSTRGVEACFAGEDEVTRDVLVQGDGGARYCEFENLDAREGREGAREACVCQALVASAGMGKRPGRRTVRVRYEAPELAGKVRPEIRVVEATTNLHSDEDWHSMEQVVAGKKQYRSVRRLVVDNVDALAAPLARCAAPAGSVIVADIQVREDGAPTAGKVVSGTSDRELVTCIERALGRGAFLCTGDGNDARVRVSLEWRAP
ncbi:hypothetical protein [Polyangium spumosum]|nr:hypothetical protein [Polyangium spumosum]